MSKCRLIVKPCQARKSWQVLNEIINFCNKGEIYEKKTVHIVVCDNNLLQTDQFAIRVKQMDAYKEGFLNCIIHNSKTLTTVREIAYDIITNSDTLPMILMCNHPTRMGFNQNSKKIQKNGDIFELLKLFSENRHSEYDFHLWIDEADVNMGLLKTLISTCHSFENLKMMNFITATPTPLFSISNEFNILPLEETVNPDEYHSIKESIFTLEDSNVNYLEFLKKFFSSKVSINPGQILFCPGERSITTHETIAEYLCSKGFNILVLNHKMKRVYMGFR